MAHRNLLFGGLPFAYWRVLLAGGLVLFLCSQPQNSTIEGGSARASSQSKAPGLDLLWQRIIGVPVSAAVSPDGKYIAVVDRDGTVRCLGDRGKTIWKVPLRGVDRVVVGPDASAVAYSFLNPADTTAYLISPSGEVISRRKVAGAIWAAAASGKAGQFAVGTGERYCYLYTISGRGHRYRRWRLPGVPCTAGFTLDGQSLIFGTWQDAGVAQYTLGGKQTVWRLGRGDRLYSVELCPSGDYAVVVARPNRNAPEGAVYLKNANLDDLWLREFPVYNLTADASASGEYVAVGYQRAITHKDKEVLENRIALYDRSGKMLWEKGGMFGRWYLLQACASGHLLLYDESAYIYILNQAGKVLLRQKLPASIRKFATTPSRNRIAICCGNGQLCVYAVK